MKAKVNTPYPFHEMLPLCGPRSKYVREGAQLIAPLGWEAAASIEEELALLGSPVPFWANLEVPRLLDYVLADGPGYLVSSRLLEALESVGQLGATVLSALLLQHPAWTGIEMPWDSTLSCPSLSEVQPSSSLSGFFVAIPPILDCGVWEKLPRNLGRKLLCVRVPPEGFPPIFEITGLQGTPYLSENGRLALEKASVQCRSLARGAWVCEKA